MGEILSGFRVTRDMLGVLGILDAERLLTQQKAGWLEPSLGGGAGIRGGNRSRGIQGTGEKSVKKAKAEKQPLSLGNYR